jgi:hypothetical protein
VDAYDSLLLSPVLLRSNWAARGFADGVHIHNPAANGQGKHLRMLCESLLHCSMLLRSYVEWKWERGAGWMTGLVLA